MDGSSVIPDTPQLIHRDRFQPSARTRKGETTEENAGTTKQRNARSGIPPRMEYEIARTSVHRLRYRSLINLENKTR